MPVLSVFQRLPLLIAESIANFYVNHSEVLSGYYNTSTKTIAWAKLYNVSNSWRTLALQHICSDIELKISAKTEEHMFEFPHFPQNIEQSTDFYRYVKHVLIVFCDVIKQPSERQYSNLSIAWPKNMTFPFARSLAIYFEEGLDQQVGDAIVAQSKMFDWVAQRIQMSMPMLQKAHIEQLHGDITDNSELAMSSNQEVNSLFRTIFERVSNLSIRAGSDYSIPNGLYLKNNMKLTSLSYHCVDNIKFFHFLIQNMSPTLGELMVSSFPMESIQLFIFNNKGEPILYPRLKRLEFHGSMFTTKKVHVKKPISPFSALRYLKWKADYAFNDDTLFRGNSDSLKYLDIEFKLELVDLLQKEKVFSNGKYSELCCVRENNVFDDHNVSAPNNILAEFTTNLITPATRVFWTDVRYSCANIMTIFSTRSYASNITTLTLERNPLTLLQLIEIVKILPSMTTLKCFFGGIDSEYKDFPHKMITDQLYEKYYPLSRCFKWLDAICIEYDLLEQLVISAIALVMLCPSFICTRTLNSMDSYSLQERVEYANANGAYNEYAERLKRLFLSQVYKF